jgi:transcription antitermination factor NusG
VVIRKKGWPETIERLRELAVGGEVLCPVEKVRIIPKRSRTRKEIEIIQPMFLGYAMIELVEGMQWARVFEDAGVYDVLCVGGSLLTVTEDELGGFKMGTVKLHDLMNGCTVEFVSGPFHGHRGLYKDGKVCVKLLGVETWIDAFRYSILRR